MKQLLGEELPGGNIVLPAREGRLNGRKALVGETVELLQVEVR